MTAMDPWSALGDPVRRRVLELLVGGEVPAGEVARTLAAELGLSQPASSQHLRVLREHGLVRVRAEGTRRLYSLDPTGLHAADAWLARFRDQWEPHLDALGTEIARGKKARRRGRPTTTHDRRTG